MNDKMIDQTITAKIDIEQWISMINNWPLHHPQFNHLDFSDVMRNQHVLLDENYRNNIPNMGYVCENKGIDYCSCNECPIG